MEKLIKMGCLAPRTLAQENSCVDVALHSHLCSKERVSGDKEGQCYLLSPNLWPPWVTPKASYCINRRTTINSIIQIPFDHQLPQVLGRLSAQGSVTGIDSAEGLLRWPQTIA